VWLSSAEIAIERIRDRVAEGGHDIPSEVVIRRYYKGMANLMRFLQVVHDWYLYDNSGSYYELVAKRVDGQEKLFNFELFRKIISHGQ
jgi:predicted ABC-type ATPase